MEKKNNIPSYDIYKYKKNNNVVSDVYSDQNKEYMENKQNNDDLIEYNNNSNNDNNINNCSNNNSPKYDYKNANLKKGKELQNKFNWIMRKYGIVRAPHRTLNLPEIEKNININDRNHLNNPTNRKINKYRIKEIKNIDDEKIKNNHNNLKYNSQLKVDQNHYTASDVLVNDNTKISLPKGMFF